MKTYIFTLLLIVAFWQTDAQTLHLIMVSDYADPKFGIVSQADEESLLEVFKTVEFGLNYRLKVSFLNSFNNRFNSISLTKAIDTLRTIPNDIIVVFYSGLGFYPPNSQSTFPTFQLSDFKKTPISVDGIAAQLKTKSVRLGMVIADCRDTVPKTEDSESDGLVDSEDLRKLIIKKLFLEKCGILKIASASKGNPTWQMPNSTNSAFVFSFRWAFRKFLNADAKSIRQLSFDSTLNLTQKSITGVLKNFIPIDKPQIAHWTFSSCDATLNSLITQFPPSTFIIPTADELDNQLTILANTTDVEERRKAIVILSEMFVKNAKIELNIEGIQSSKMNLSIEQYIARTATYDKKIKRNIEFDFFDFIRTLDFKKFVSLKFTEKTN